MKDFCYPLRLIWFNPRLQSKRFSPCRIIDVHIWREQDTYYMDIAINCENDPFYHMFQERGSLILISIWMFWASLKLIRKTVSSSMIGCILDIFFSVGLFSWWDNYFYIHLVCFGYSRLNLLYDQNHMKGLWCFGVRELTRIIIVCLTDRPSGSSRV